MFNLPPPPTPSEALSSSSLIPASLITDSANLTPAPLQPCINEEERRWERLHTTPAHHEVVARNPKRNYDSLARRCCCKLFQAFSGLPAQYKLAVWVIHSHKEMVEQIGADNSVDLFHTEVFRELAQRKHCNGQVLDGPVADGERVDPPLLDIGVLAAGESALDRPESRHAKLPAEVRIESHH